MQLQRVNYHDARAGGEPEASITRFVCRRLALLPVGIGAEDAVRLAKIDAAHLRFPAFRDRAQLLFFNPKYAASATDPKIPPAVIEHTIRPVVSQALASGDLKESSVFIKVKPLVGAYPEPSLG